MTKRFVFDMNQKRRSFKRTEDVELDDLAGSLAERSEAGEGSMDMGNYTLYYNDDILNALRQLKPIYQEALLLQQSGYKLTEIMEESYRNGNLKTKNI